jgi:hypothetical protein
LYRTSLLCNRIRNIATIIEVLTTLFGEGYEFRPEPISEGGIIMTNWPGKEEGRGFKTVRFKCLKSSIPGKKKLYETGILGKKIT